MLTFSRSGRYLAYVTGGQLGILDVAAARMLGGPQPTGVLALATVGDEIWALASEGNRTALWCYVPERGLAERACELPSAGAVELRGARTACVAILQTGAAAYELRGEPRPIAVEPLAGGRRLVPIAAGRRLVFDAEGASIEHGGGATRLAAMPRLDTERIADAEIMSSGETAAVLHLDGTATMLVIGLLDGALRQRTLLDGARRALFVRNRPQALVQGGELVRLFDLRFGRILAARELAAGDAVLAIDGEGQQIAVLQRDGSEPLRIHNAREFFARGPMFRGAPAHAPPPHNVEPAPAPVERTPAEPTAATPATPPSSESAAPAAFAEPRASEPEERGASEPAEPRASEPEERGASEPAEPRASEPAGTPRPRKEPGARPVAWERWSAPTPRLAPVATFTDGAPIALPRLEALAPRDEDGSACPEQVAVLFLECYLDLAAAWCQCAIATAWDSGRLTFSPPRALPYEAEVAGLVGREGGRAPQQMAAAAQRMREVQAACAFLWESAAFVADAGGFRVVDGHSTMEPQARRFVAPITTIAREFGLSELACDVLFAVVAPHLRPALPRLYGILRNDPARPLCDEMLVYQLLAGHANRLEVARELQLDAPLVRWGLVRVGAGTPPFAALTPSPVVLERLRGEAAPPVPANVTLYRSGCALDELRVPRTLIDEMATALSRPRESPIRVALAGRNGSGRRTLLSALAGAAGRKIAVVDALRCAYAGGGPTELRRTLLEASLCGWLPCVTGLDRLRADETTLKQQLIMEVDAHPGPVALRVGPGWESPMTSWLRFTIPPLNEEERCESWRAALGRSGLPVEHPEALAARHNVAHGVIRRVTDEVAASMAAARTIGSPAAPVAEALERELCRSRDSSIQQIASRVTRLADWNDIVMPDDIRENVSELIGRIRHRRRVFESWGFDRVMSTSRGVTALFQGGPGTGKTMIAGVIARELAFDLYRIDVARIMSKWIGETEKNLAELFDAADDGQVMLLFDEADALFAKRTEVKSSVDRYANVEVNYLLQRMDSFNGIALLTTNLGSSIDPAFKRRLTMHITFPFPEEEMRERIWRVHLPPELPTDGPLDLRGLASRHKLSGGYIRNAALRAAFLAAQEGIALTQAHLERAVRLEYQSAGKILEGGMLE